MYDLEYIKRRQKLLDKKRQREAEEEARKQEEIAARVAKMQLEAQ